MISVYHHIDARTKEEKPKFSDDRVYSMVGPAEYTRLENNQTQVMKPKQKKTLSLKTYCVPLQKVFLMFNVFFEKDWLKQREKTTPSKLLKTKTHIPLSNLKKFCSFAVRSLVQKLEFDNYNFFKKKKAKREYKLQNGKKKDSNPKLSQTLFQKKR